VTTRRALGGLAWVALAGCSAALDFGAECGSSADCVGVRVCAQGFCVLADAGIGERDARRPAPTGEIVNAACPTLFGATEEEVKAGRAVVIGSLLPLTGGLSGVGPLMEKAVWLAADQINQLGGVDGRKLAVLSCDDGTGGDDKAVNAARHLVAQVGVQAIVGPAASSTSILVLGSVARPAGVVLVSPSATSPDLTAQLDDDLLWRTAPSDEIQGAAVSAWLKGEGIERVAVVTRNDSYGNALGDAIRRSYCPMCTPEQLFTRSYDPAMLNAAEVVTALQAFGPQATVFVSYFDDGVALLNASGAAMGVPLDRFVLTDGVRDARIVTEVTHPEVLDALFGTAPATPAGETYAAFVSDFRGRWATDAGQFSANAYDATYLLALAIAAAGEGATPTGAQIAQNLKRLSIGPSVAVGRGQFLEALRALRASETATINLQGASGPLDFDPRTGEAPADIEGWRVNRAAGRIESTGTLYTADGVYTPPADAGR